MPTTLKKRRRTLTNYLTGPVSSLVAGLIIKALFRSVDNRFLVEEPAAIPQRRTTPGLYIFWHEMLLLPAYSHAHLFASLISESRDGALIARVVRRFGGTVIRGSTTHGRLRAFREIRRLADQRHIAIAADGPRGPVRKVPIGIVRIAAVTGRPVIPVGIAYERYFTVGPREARISFPRPFSGAWAVVGSPIAVPPISRAQRGDYLLKVQVAIDQVQGRAERLAGGQERTDEFLTLKDARSL